MQGNQTAPKETRFVSLRPEVHNYYLNHAGIYWYTCRCRKPTAHFDSVIITDPIEAEGANYALDLTGRAVMSRPMLWELLETRFRHDKGLMAGVKREQAVMEIFGDGRMI